MENTKLTWKELKFLILLGIPSLGLALVYTLVTTYLPIFIAPLSNATVTGMMIGGEGIFALCVPYLIGTWSDSINTSIGRRLPFVFAGVALTSIAVILMPFSTNSLLALGVELALFFIGYFTIYEAYYAFYPDFVPMHERGRSQGILGGFRSIGMLLALTGGGVLIHVWHALPFVIVIIVLIMVTVVLYYTIKPRIRRWSEKSFNWLASWDLIVENRKIRDWVVANCCWEAAVSCLRVFIVLYFTKGLNLSLTESSAALALVGISAIVAAPLAGFLADKYSHKPVIIASVIFFGVGLFPPIFTTDTYFIAGILPVAFSAVILMTLPFSLLMGYLPKEEQHGAGAALFGFCQGIGVLLGPLISGWAIDSTKQWDFLVFKETQGYSAIYPVASLFLFISLPFTISLFKGAENE